MMKWFQNNLYILSILKGLVNRFGGFA